MITDTDARVLDLTGQPIQGLYAVGGSAAPVCPTYPTGGCSLDPAVTFAWQAARDIAKNKAGVICKVGHEV